MNYKKVIRKGKEEHLVVFEDGFITTYENLVKNYYRRDYDGMFIVKKLTINGEEAGAYFSATREIFKSKVLFEITKKFNPELLV